MFDETALRLFLAVGVAIGVIAVYSSAETKVAHPYLSPNAMTYRADDYGGGEAPRRAEEITADYLESF